MTPVPFIRQQLMPGVRPMKESMPMNNEYVERFESPDGSFVIEVMSEEVRMSHWINSFRIVKNGSRVVAWEPARSWSLESHTWLNGNEVEVVLRKYPDSPYLMAKATTCNPASVAAKRPPRRRLWQPTGWCGLKHSLTT